MKKTALWPLCCAILLTACTGVPQTKIKVIKPEIPPGLRQCKAVPEYPGENMTQRDIAKNYAELWFAHKDCKSKLEAVGRALQQSEQKER